MRLSLVANSKIANAAAFVVSLEIRHLSFCDVHEVMRMFAKSIFEMDQSFPVNENIDPSGYFPRRTADTNAVHDISNNLRTKFWCEASYKALCLRCLPLSIIASYRVSC